MFLKDYFLASHNYINSTMLVMWREQSGVTDLIKRADIVCQFKNLVTLSFPLEPSQPESPLC